MPDFSFPRSRPRCCLSVQRWPLITYGEEASSGSHFDASNIQPAAVATGSIIASANALAAADSGRPPHRAASLSRVAIELRQPIRLNLRRTSGASRYRPFRDLRISSRAARRPAARPASQAPPHLNGTSTSTQRRTSDSRAPPRAPTSRPSRCLACCDGMRVLSCTHYVGAREHSLRRGCCPSVAAHGLRRRLLLRRVERCARSRDSLNSAPKRHSPGAAAARSRRLAHVAGAAARLATAAGGTGSTAYLPGAERRRRRRRAGGGAGRLWRLHVAQLAREPLPLAADRRARGVWAHAGGVDGGVQRRRGRGAVGGEGDVFLPVRRYCRHGGGLPGPVPRMGPPPVGFPRVRHDEGL
jgi:hypothetical protein